MRPFEIILLLANLLALVLAFRKQSQAVWLRIAGLNLLALLIHGIFEGFRYQMAFAYTFVTLLLIFSVFKTKTPKVLKFISVSLSLLLLGFTAFLVYALPVFTLPKPTGNYVVGIRYFHLVDKNRADPFLDKTAKKRELMIKVYYPAQPNDTKPYASYFHNSPELVRLLTTGYGMPSFLFDHLTLVKTNSKDGLPISNTQQSYPVILFSHGAGTTMEVQNSQSEDLASHGYIVVAIDHTYVSAGTVFPERVVSAKEATTDFHVVDPAEVITQIMADDACFVIDQLEEINETDSFFKEKLNLDEMGIVGHSVGGAVAYNLAINNARIKAAIDLDGAVFMSPNKDVRTVAPFLMIANDKYHVQAILNYRPLMKKYQEMDDLDRTIALQMFGSQPAYEEAYTRAQQHLRDLIEVLKASGNLFTIEGSDHMKFTDIGLFIGVQPLRELIGIGGKTDPAKCLEITKAVTLAFFDQHLKKENSGLLQSLPMQFPELKNVSLE